MIQTIYKILFEVRLLNEFYLTKQDGTSIFSKTSPAERTSFLHDFFKTDQPSIDRDVSYMVPSTALSFFKNHRLKLVQTYSGFKVATEVNRTVDGTQTAFEPVVPLARNSPITVFIERNNADIDTYTNARMKNTIKKIFYLSNESTNAAKTFPFLANPIPPKDINYPYEQGELSVEGGVVKSFYVDNTKTPPQQWLDVTGMNFINETDRLIVTPFFNYSFDASDNVKNAQFIIKDNSGTEVYNNSFASDSLLQTISIRIDPINLKKISPDRDTNDLLYSLSVTGDGRYNKTFQLIFLDAPAGETPWGVVSINPIPSDPAFNIIDTKGFLITRLNPDGTVAVAPPVFEIWMKSKFAFWRYINNDGSQLKNLFPGILIPAGNNLVTLEPLNHSYLPVPVSAQRFPNPKPFSIIKNEGVQNFADIIVPVSDTFPKGP